MRKILNKNLHLHIKVRDKRHPINIGLVFIVILASIITWFLTEYTVYQLNEMDLAAVSWVSEVRPKAKAAGVYYISPTGSDANSGTGCSSAFLTFSYAQGRLSPGDTLYLCDGTYTYSNTGMLCIAKSGTSGTPIAYKAVNDGAVTVDGQNKYQPFTCYGYNYITVEGIRFKNSFGHVVYISSAHDIIMRRVTAHDAVYTDSTYNSHVFNIQTDSYNILLEDCAAWGWGRNLLLIYARSHDVTVRRFFMSYHDRGGSVHGPACSQIYDAHDVLFENVICTQDGNYTGPYLTGLSIWDNDTSGEVYNVALKGTVVYDLGMTDYRYCSYMVASKGSGTGDQQQMYGITHANIVGIGSECGINPMDAKNNDINFATFVGANTDNIKFDKGDAQFWNSTVNLKDSVIMNAAVCGVDYHDIPETFTHTYNTWYNNQSNFCDSAQGSTENNINPSFDTTKYGKGAYLMQPDALKGYGSGGGNIGAEVLYRYKNGTLTSEPLWPWPMEKRIMAEAGMSVTWESGGGLWKTLDGVYSTASVCGDGVCDSSETCSSCPADCGECPRGIRLANSNTMTSNSANFDPNHAVEHLWDGCVEIIPECSTGAGNIASFWVEFDFGQNYDLTLARLFGDTSGNWQSRTWQIEYKLNSGDPWTAAFTGKDAFMDAWSTENLSNITTRYARVTVYGNPDYPATQAQELEIYGDPSGSVSATYEVLKTPAPPAIDGQLAEYADANSIILSNARGTAGTYRLLYDSTALYISADVNDSEPNAIHFNNDESLWEDDSIELFFDTLHNAGASMGTDDYKFFVNLNNAHRDERGGIGSAWNANYTSAVKKTTNSYTIEIAIPWSNWGISPPSADSTWGFDLSQNDRDNAGVRTQTVWTNADGDTSNNPDGWGDMLFSSQSVPEPPPSLSVGLHTITLTATDQNGNTTQDTIQIEILPENTLAAQISLLDTEYTQGDTIYFSSSVSGGTSPYTYSWKSDKQGNFSTQSWPTVNTSAWQTGTHNITLTVTDSQSKTTTDNITITVNPANLAVFKSGFESPVAMSGWLGGTNWYKETTGADQGYDWETDFITTDSFWNIILNKSTYPEPDNCIGLDITTDEHHSGSKALYMEVKKSCKYNSVETRVSHHFGVSWPYNEAHFKAWLKIPSATEAALRGDGGSINLNELRNPEDPGGLRIVFEIFSDAGAQLKFRIWSELWRESGWQQHWLYIADNVTVPLDQWFQYEVYYHPRTYSQGGGAYWIKINGTKILEQVPTATTRICGASASDATCAKPFAWNMIKCYTYDYPVKIYLDDIELYDKYTP